MMQALLITQGTGGDIIPFLGIGSALRRRGYSVTVFTHHGYEQIVRQAGLDFLAMDGPHEFEQFIADGSLLNNPQGIPAFFQRHILPSVPAHYEVIRARARAGDLVVVARHLVDIAGRLAAEKLGVPLVRVFTAPAQAGTMPVLAAICRDILAPDINRIRALIELPSVRDWEAWTSAPAHSIALWPEWFAAPDSSWPAGVVPVGFMRHTEVENDELPAEVKAFLNQGEPPILVSGSTGTFTIEGFYPASVEACRLAGRRAILLSRQPQHIPAQHAQDVRWFARLPFASLIQRVGAAIHHGGMGTVAHAIAAGIPQVALPLGSDRPDVGARVQRLGIGECLHPQQCTPIAIAGALGRLLDSAAVRARCEDFARRMHNAEPAARAGEAIEAFIRAGTPTAEPAWCQAAEPPAGSTQGVSLSERMERISANRQALLLRRLSERGAN